ncbi:TetR/AcrR family transcriptional regulator [candidate division KSB1 bacterium]|nr:TetR/AcrR family transcriptional regulator [candidate division KSB1 bacterium]
MRSDKRERLLKAAVKVFARDGFFHAKVETIAKEAGVATGTTYLYFDNKDDILISIFEEEMIPIIEGMKKELAVYKGPKEKLIAFVHRFMKMAEENPDMTQLLEIELRQSSKFMHGYKSTKFKEYLDIISDAFVLGQETGVFRQDVQPTLLKQILFGALDQITMNWTLSKSKKFSLQQSAEQILNVVLKGILIKDTEQ